jgi:isopenicillin N synthase-like dioxygenase
VAVIAISAQPSQVVGKIGRACREIGFLTVVGHGVAEEIVDSTAEAARAFFDLPADEKLAFTRGEQTLGLPVYRPLRSESLAASLGQETPGDLKESLD